MSDQPVSDEVVASLLTRAMDGQEQSRLGDLETAKALDELRSISPASLSRAIIPIYKEVLYKMDGTRDLQARLTEFVSDEDGHR